MSESTRGVKPGHVFTDYSEPKVYPSGRKVTLRRPHSVWQLMIDERMFDKELSLRDLAQMVSTKSEPITHTRLFNWLRHQDGHPPPKSYTRAINTRIAKALDFEPSALAKAYEESRRVFGISEPAPRAQALDDLLRAAQAVGKDPISLSDLSKLVDDLKRS